MNTIDILKKAILNGEAAGNPVIHVGISDDLLRAVSLDAEFFTVVESLDKKILGIPYTVVSGDNRLVTLNLAYINAIANG